MLSRSTKLHEVKVNKTENPFSLQDDEYKLIRSPKKPYGVLRVALRNPKGNPDIQWNPKGHIFCKKGDIAATTTTITGI